MPISQNVRFRAEPPTDAEFPHPPGAAIARMLAPELAGRGWAVSEFDNWRDAGWFMECARGAARLEVSLAPIGTREWLLQVAPTSAPGPLGRLIGRVPSATPDDCLELARAVHSALVASGGATNLSWAWDGMPGDGASAEPQAREVAR